MLDNGHMQDNYCRKSKVIRVIDGDTIECEIDLGYSITTRQRFRIKGIDTPELKGSDILKALEAKSYLIKLVEGREVIIESCKTDSFGRYLANLYIIVEGVQIDVAKVMIRKGLGKPYERK